MTREHLNKSGREVLCLFSGSLPESRPDYREIFTPLQGGGRGEGNCCSQVFVSLSGGRRMQGWAPGIGANNGREAAKIPI